MDKLLPGIITKRVPTSRLTVNVLSVAGRGDGPPVLFVHGNVSSSLFWQPLMLALPESYRPLAIDLRGFGDTDPEPVDATRGLRDYADDLAAVIDALGLESVHLIGWSMGGGVVLQYLVDRPGTHRVASLTLEDPVSPFGFGGTRGLDGTLCDPWAAGTGAGGAGTQAPDPVGARRRRRHRLRHVPVRPGLPRLARRDPRLAGGADLAATAHGGADPVGTARLRRVRWPVPRGSDRRRRPRSAPGPAREVPRRAARSPSRRRARLTGLGVAWPGL